MKKFLFLTVKMFLLAFFAAAQIPGLHSTYFFDDFAASQTYENAPWWSSFPTYLLTRNEDGKLKIHATNADASYENFGVSFIQNIDLRSNAKLSFLAENTSSTNLTINIYLVDINNKIASVRKDTGDGSYKKQVADTIYAGTSKHVTLDLEGTLIADQWICSNPKDCPSVTNDFRWDKVTSILFTFNGGAGVLKGVPYFTGDVYFKDLIIGSEPCLPLTGNVAGDKNVCSNTSVLFSVPSVEGATDYLWSVPAGAQIISGQGTNAIEVNFGTNSGEVSVRPSKQVCSGSISKIYVKVNHLLEASQLSGETTVCERSEKFYSINSDQATTSYEWFIPEGSSIITNNGNLVKLKFGPNSGVVRVVESNSCGSIESSIEVNVTNVGDQPTVSKEGNELTSSDAAYYQWYRYNEPIDGANGKTFNIEYSGEYKVNISEEGCPNFSNAVFEALSMLNGVNKTFVKDDFATIEPYTNLASGFPMTWWTSSVYNLTRNGDGKLRIDVTNGDPNWNSFGLQWANASSDSALDLTNNANVHLIVENPTSQDLDFWVQLTDINNITVNVLAFEGQWLDPGMEYAHVLIPANSEREVNIDLTGGYAMNWSCVCPANFDWTKVKNIIFQANPGSGSIFSSEPFNGTFYIKDLMLGTYIAQDGSSLVAAEARSFRWKRNGQHIDGANAKIFTPIEDGKYSVELEDTDGQTYESASISFIVSGIKHSQESGYRVFPNPSEGIFNFESEEAAIISIIDALGKDVRTLNGNMVQIDLTSLPKGFYYLKIKQGKNEFTEKLIKL